MNYPRNEDLQLPVVPCRQALEIWRENAWSRRRSDRQAQLARSRAEWGRSEGTKPLRLCMSPTG